MQIDIAEAVLEDMWKACAIPGKSSSDLASSWCRLGFISWPSSPSASAKDDKVAEGWVRLQVFSLGVEIDDMGRGGLGLKTSESFLGRWGPWDNEGDLYLGTER